jgi:hypothetical protein
MKRIGYNSLALLATVAFVVIASAAFAATPTPNGIVSNPTLWNDYPQANPTWTNNYPTLVQYNFDCPFALTGWGEKGIFELSGDNGATKLLFPNKCNYEYEADVTLSGTNVGHLEGGLMIAPWWNDDGGVFMCNVGNGEITEWGGIAPFYSFSATYSLTYALGAPIHQKIRYVAGSSDGPTEANPGTFQYSIIYGGVPYSSPVIACGAANPNDPPHGTYGQLDDTKLGGSVMGGPIMGDANVGAGTLVGTFGNIIFTNLDGQPSASRTTSWGTLKAMYR